MPSRRSSATSRSRSDSGDLPAAGGRRGAGFGSSGFVGEVRNVRRQLEVAGDLEHGSGHPWVRGLQRRLPRQPGGVPGQAELGQAAGGGGHLVDVDLAGQHPQPGPAGTRQCGGEAVGLRGRGQRLAVRGHGFRRVGQDRGMHTRPVQRQ